MTSGAFYTLTLTFVARNLPPKLLLFGVAAYAMDIVVTSNVAALNPGLVYGPSVLALDVLDGGGPHPDHDAVHLLRSSACRRRAPPELARISVCERRAEPDLWRSGSGPAAGLVEFRSIRRHAGRRIIATVRGFHAATLPAQSAGEFALPQRAQHRDPGARRIYDKVCSCSRHWRPSRDFSAAFNSTGPSRPARLWPGSQLPSSFLSGSRPSAVVFIQPRIVMAAGFATVAVACRMAAQVDSSWAGGSFLSSRTLACRRHCRRIRRPGGEPPCCSRSKWARRRTLPTPLPTRPGCTPCA
jgi:hypothetical protein